MNAHVAPLLTIAWMTAVLSVTAFAQPLGNGFSYQGKLEQSGVIVDGSTDFQFRLFSAPAAGTQIGAMQPFFDVPVVDGLFTVSLDFGATAFNGNARWLEIAVRNVDAAPFTTLSPRQSLTAVPYALKVPGIDGHSLNGADGLPIDALFVDNAGYVGIGTIAPQAKLHLVTSDEGIRIQGSAVGVSNSAYVAFTNSASSPIGYVGDGSTLDNAVFLSADAGDVVLNTVAGRVVNVKPSGNVGIGTTGPAARLDVRGDVKLGPSGQYFAPAGNENLRLVRGTIDGAGTVIRGSGFTAVRQSTGDYRITFDTPFQSAPCVTATVDDEVDSFPNADFFVAGIYQAGTNSVRVRVRVLALNQSFAGPDNHAFHFCAIGPR